MKKMPCLFQRDFTDPVNSTLLQEVTPGCEWVLAGEGTASRKRDGTACAVRDGKLFKRYDCKKGKAPPTGFIPCSEPDPITGHWPGWIEVGEGPEDQWHRQAWQNVAHVEDSLALPDGTYELCGPKIQGNPEGFSAHVFIRHGAEMEAEVPRDWDGLRTYMEEYLGEGLVWAHPDGRMCKLRRGDFGFVWPIKAS